MVINIIAKLIVAKSRSKREKRLIYRYHTLKAFSYMGILYAIDLSKLTNRANRYIGRARRDYENNLREFLELEGYRDGLTIYYVSSTKVIKPKEM